MNAYNSYLKGLKETKPKLAEKAIKDIRKDSCLEFEINDSPLLIGDIYTNASYDPHNERVKHTWEGKIHFSIIHAVDENICLDNEILEKNSKKISIFKPRAANIEEHDVLQNDVFDGKPYSGNLVLRFEPGIYLEETHLFNGVEVLSTDYGKFDTTEYNRSWVFRENNKGMCMLLNNGNDIISKPLETINMDGIAVTKKEKERFSHRNRRICGGLDMLIWHLGIKVQGYVHIDPLSEQGITYANEFKNQKISALP